jgi:hypothetical protein
MAELIFCLMPKVMESSTEYLLFLRAIPVLHKEKTKWFLTRFNWIYAFYGWFLVEPLLAATATPGRGLSPDFTKLRLKLTDCNLTEILESEAPLDAWLEHLETLFSIAKPKELVKISKLKKNDIAVDKSPVVKNYCKFIKELLGPVKNVEDQLVPTEIVKFKVDEKKYELR